MFIADVLVDFAKSTFQNVYFAKSTFRNVDFTKSTILQIKLRFVQGGPKKTEPVTKVLIYQMLL